MGIFFSYSAAEQPRAVQEFDRLLRDTLVNTYGADPAEAETTAARIELAAGVEERRFNAWNLIGALAIFGVIATAAVATDAADLGESSRALWTFAGAIFAVIVAWFSAEKAGGA